MFGGDFQTISGFFSFSSHEKCQTFDSPFSMENFDKNFGEWSKRMGWRLRRILHGESGVPKSTLLISSTFLLMISQSRMNANLPCTLMTQHCSACDSASTVCLFTCDSQVNDLYGIVNPLARKSEMSGNQLSLNYSELLSDKSTLNLFRTLEERLFTKYGRTEQLVSNLEASNQDSSFRNFLRKLEKFPL
jgi:hypothetical protein